MLAKIEIEDMGADHPVDQRWICFMQGDFSPVYVRAGSLSEICKKMSKLYPEEKKKPAPAAPPPEPAAVARAAVQAPHRAVPRHPAPAPTASRR